MGLFLAPLTILHQVDFAFDFLLVFASIIVDPFTGLAGQAD
jgi:hypothetical protein